MADQASVMDIVRALADEMLQWRQKNQQKEAAFQAAQPAPAPPIGPKLDDALGNTPNSQLSEIQKWLKQDGPIQRVIKSADPMAEPLVPMAPPSQAPEPDTYWGGFAKGLKDYARDTYNQVVRPQLNLTAPAMLMGGEESVAGDVAKSIPAGLSKLEFANLLKGNPELQDRLMKLATDQAGELRLPVGRLGELIKKTRDGYQFKADSLRRMAEAIKAGEGLGKLWTPLSEHLAAFDEDPKAAEMFSRVWGATSPNTPVARNNYEALQAWKRVMSGDIPFTAKDARASDLTMVGAKVPNLNRAINFEPIQGGKGEIGKTENMAQLIAGDKSAIPIDVHALAGVGASEDNIGAAYSGLRALAGGKRGQFSYTDLYNLAKEAYQNGLAKFGADFPTMWEGVKKLKGQGQSAGMTSWLQKWGLLEPGAMMNPDALDHVIQNVDRAEFYGRGLKNVELSEPKPYVQLLEKHSELGSQPKQIQDTAQIVRDLTAKNQGTTYNLLNGDLSNAKGPMFAVAAYPERSVSYPNSPKTSQLVDFITKNIDLLKDPSNSIGTWWDKDAKQFTLDITKTVPDRDLALQLGHHGNQKAIFDLQSMSEIPLTAETQQELTTKAANTPSLLEPFSMLGQVPTEYSQSALETPQRLSVEDVANGYAAKKGLPNPTPHSAVKVNKEFAKNVAAAYEAMQHNPNDPAVKKAYDALRSEVSDQFEHITKEGGLKVTPWTKEGQPYKNSAEMMADVKKNNHLFYFPTEKGFGTTEAADHPLLQPGRSGLPANDELRIVHDYLAHALGGHSFGPNGEENAFIEHTKLLSPEARKALATETRGQNSWVNFFGNHASLPQAERPFAPQKAGLLPDELQEVFPGKKRTPPATKAPVPSDSRMDELVRKFGKDLTADEKLQLILDQILGGR